MKTRATFIAAAIFCLFALPASSATADVSVADIFRHVDGYDFRKTRWGMSPEEVIKSEDFTIMTNFTVNHDGTPNENGSIIYVANIDDYGINITYSFKMNKLVLVLVKLDKEPSSQKEHVKNFDNIQETITNTYKQPEGEIAIDDKDRFMMFSHWKTNRTDIGLSFSDAGDKEFLFTVSYSDVKNVD